MQGPLQGLKVIEMAGIGPCPFAAMVLGDMGADVIRIERLNAMAKSAAEASEQEHNPVNRGKRSIAIDLKSEAGRRLVLDLCRQADVVVEGFRPGVMERLGLGPEQVMGVNPAVVYGRMTGWGQSGPLAQRSGHDINYISVSGSLSAIGERGGPPQIPLNLIGDFGGGGMLLVVGVLGALISARTTGKGDVVDAAMVDGSALLSTLIYSMIAAGIWKDERGSNLLDGGSPFYCVYRCADGEYVSVGPLEPQFYSELLEKLGLSEDTVFKRQNDQSHWPAMRERLAAIFGGSPRDYWEKIFQDSDACVAPVLSLLEAPHHPHNMERDTFVTVDGVLQPSPAPRFSLNPLAAAKGSRAVGADTIDILRELAVPTESVAALVEEGVVGYWG